MRLLKQHPLHLSLRRGWQSPRQDGEARIANPSGMLALVAVALMNSRAASEQGLRIEYFGAEVGFRARHIGGEWLEELFAKDAKGKWRAVLCSPNHDGVAIHGRQRAPALKAMGAGLFDEAPGHAFRDAAIEFVRGGGRVELSREDGDVRVTKRLRIPEKGRVIRIELEAAFDKPGRRIEYFVDSYAFYPDRKSIGKGGKPDSTFSPGLRPKDNQVVGDHFFRAPVISAQRGPLAALMLPDVDVLAENRPIPTVLDLDAKNGVADAALMSYGFADFRLAGHVYFTHDSSMVRRVPKELFLAYDLILDARAEPFGAYRQAVTHTWEKVGRREFDKVLPQAMPFEEYARFCYPAAFGEAYGTNNLGWFEVEVDGQVCGGVPSGWGFQQGWVSWQCWFNQLRSAWGLRWWGKRLGEADWVAKADKMLNLALAAPMDRGACPTTYQSREKKWLGSLIRPREDCYYDLTNMAWKGIWLLRWLEFEDCPRREEIAKQCREMAVCMTRFQNADGSFPTWLTKEFKVVPILDHSAQSALPLWFLVEWNELQGRPLWDDPGLPGSFVINPKTWKIELDPSEMERFSKRLAENSDLQMELSTRNIAIQRAATFLVRNVVSRQRYYDFETFFSCSPKQCMQVNGVLDDVLMHDAHTLSPPQNTLCMQWTAEALTAAAKHIEHSIAWPSDDDPRPRIPNPGGRLSRDQLEDRRTERFRTSLSKSFRAASLKALDIMTLYQNVWSISWIKSAYTFGGFGVQNSDGEFLDARQAQFGCTLADFGAALGRQDYFERGVAATRASMTLINHPLHAANGLYPNPNYPPGLQPENVAHGGWDHQAGRTGFDWGEGSGLASMAWLLNKYGPTYAGKGWRVLVDGGMEGQKHFPKTPAPLVDPTFDFSDWRMKGWTVEGNFPDVPTHSERMDFGLGAGEAFIGTCEDGSGGFDDEYRGSVTSPPFIVSKQTIRLLVGGGAGLGVYVELIDDGGKQLFVERGRNRERMDERVWDASSIAGKTVRIRVADTETGGWGHVNVARIRCVDR